MAERFIAHYPVATSKDDRYAVATLELLQHISDQMAELIETLRPKPAMAFLEAAPESLVRRDPILAENVARPRKTLRPMKRGAA